MAEQRFASGDATICPYCDHEDWVFSQARSIGPYDEDLRMAIHRLKFRGQRELSRALANLMFVAIEPAWWQEIDCLVPVPLHSERVKQRGFNQSELLAYELALRANRPMQLLLERVISTKSQTGLSRQLRRLNVHGAFRVIPEATSLIGKCVLLVDDVMTTGSTLSACAEALLKAGAKEVRVVTAAVTNIR